MGGPPRMPPGMPPPGVPANMPPVNQPGAPAFPTLEAVQRPTASLRMRPPTQTAIMGGQGQRLAFAKGGRVSVLAVHKTPKGKGAAKVGTVMHEWGVGKLHSGSKKGPVVKSQKQAVAIGLSEARKAGANIPAQKGK